MTDFLDEDAPRPIPREWLPEPLPSEGSPQWQGMAARVSTALAAGVATYERQSGVRARQWPAVLGTWWRPAAVLAVAASAAFLLISAAQPRPAQSGALPLVIMATGGEPTSLMRGLGIDADPVLALIAMLEEAR